VSILHIYVRFDSNRARIQIPRSPESQAGALSLVDRESNAAGSWPQETQICRSTESQILVTPVGRHVQLNPTDYCCDASVIYGQLKVILIQKNFAWKRGK
jgi:hypothetical protein